MKPTPKQVIAWAREAGATRDHPEHLPDLWTMDTIGVLQLADLAYEAGRKDENEACARVCDERANLDGFEGSYADKCAAAIRARREK